MVASDQLSSTFAALADPTRRAILTTLTKGEASVQTLAEPFAMSLPAVSRHLKVLERAGLIERGKQAQWRPCRLRAHPLKDVADWVEEYRAFWEASFDRLDAYLKEVQANAGTKSSARPRKAARKRADSHHKKGVQHARKKQSDR